MSHHCDKKVKYLTLLRVLWAADRLGRKYNTEYGYYHCDRHKCYHLTKQSDSREYWDPEAHAKYLKEIGAV